MSRPRKNRKICNPPKMKGFKPFGLPICEIENIKMTFEEYESIKLINYEMLSQDQASEQMSISRPTFTRLYNTALKSIAKAFVEGRMITIKGGQVYFDSNWYHCDACNCFFNNPDKDIQIECCPLCGQDKYQSINILDPNGEVSPKEKVKA